MIMLMGFTPSLKMSECVRMSEVTMATRSRDSAYSNFGHSYILKHGVVHSLLVMKDAA